MKILLLTKSITTIGGVQRVVISLANALSKLHDVTIVSNDSINKKTNYELNNVLRIDINTINTKFYHFSFIKRVIRKLNRYFRFLNNSFFEKINISLNYKKDNINKLSKYINDNNFDIVIGAQGEMVMYLSLISNMINAKTIGWNHNVFDSYYYLRGNYFYGEEYLFKKYISNLDEIVVLSNYDQDRYKKEWDIDTTTITNIKSFNSVIKSDLTKKNFLAVGRFVHSKGFDILIEAFNLFYQDNKEYRLTIIGDGLLENNYIELIKSYDLQHSVFILNSINNIQPYLLNSCCLIMPSRFEGLGMVMVEAFEVGVPVIAFNLPTIKDYLIDDYNGLKCVEFGYNNLYLTIKKYTETNIMKYQKNCIETSNIFNEENIISKWNELFNN